MLGLLDARSREIIRTEATADVFMEAAAALVYQRPEAEAIRDTALRKRVKAIELRGELAALQDEYTARFLPGA